MGFFILNITLFSSFIKIMNTDSIPFNHVIDSILLDHKIYDRSESDGSEWAIGFAFFIPLLIALMYIGYKRWQNRKWMQGVFPQELTYSKTNLMEAYSSLTVYFITLDRFHQMRKIAHLKLFFINYFKQIPEKYDDMIDRNFHYPIDPLSVIKWINLHANENQKKQLIQFLVGLCHIDTILQKKEYDALKVITKTLQLDSIFLEETIFSYRGNDESSESRNGYKSTHRAIEKPKTVSKLKHYCEILGISENASKTEIKQRYRHLAKLYHPDRYVKESKEKQEQAHQRFLEIQEAYEFLMA